MQIKNATQYGNQVVFMQSVKIKLYGYTMFAHIILEPDKKAKARSGRDVNINLAMH